MRARNIKPGFFDNEILGSADPLIALLFEGLWCMADREGRLEDRPMRIRKQIFGYRDVTSAQVDRMLTWLDIQGFIQRYDAGDDHGLCIFILEFSKHQRPHSKEKPSEIPAPIEKKHLPKQASMDLQDWSRANPDGDVSALRSGEGDAKHALIPDSGSRIPDSGFRATRAQSATRASEPDDARAMDQIREAYPKHTGRSDWITAEHHVRLHIERDEETWGSLLDAVQRYAHFCANDGVSSPKYVLTPARFFSAADKPWRHAWIQPPTPGEQRQEKNVEAGRAFLASQR